MPPCRRKAKENWCKVNQKWIEMWHPLTPTHMFETNQKNTNRILTNPILDPDHKHLSPTWSVQTLNSHSRLRAPKPRFQGAKIEALVHIRQPRRRTETHNSKSASYCTQHNPSQNSDHIVTHFGIAEREVGGTKWTYRELAHGPTKWTCGACPSPATPRNRPAPWPGERGQAPGVNVQIGDRHRIRVVLRGNAKGGWSATVAKGPKTPKFHTLAACLSCRRRHPLISASR